MRNVPLATCGICSNPLAETLRTIGARDLEQLERAKVIRTYDAGEALFYEGEPPLAAYCVRRGRVKLRRATAQGGDLVLGFLKAGDMAGIESVIADESHDTSAVAVVPTTACILSHALLHEQMLSHPATMLLLFRQTVHRLRVMRRRLVDLAYAHPTQRLADALIVLLEDEAGPAPTYTLHVSRGDLAEMAGVSPETISRVLAAMAESGVVRLTRTEIEVRDRNALRQLAHQ